MINTLSSPTAVDMGNSMKVASGAQRTDAVRQENSARLGPVVPQNGNETVVIDDGRNSQGRIQARKTAHSETAGRVRNTDAALDAVEDKIDKMDNALTGIVKHYPPFPPGSEERIERLENFSAFRKEIERLTFPPDPFSESTSNSETGETDETVPPFSFPRMEDLDIPDLSAGEPEATDEEIETALESLEKAKELVDEKRQALKDSAKKVFETTDPYPATGVDTRPLDDNTAIKESQNLLSFLKGNDSGLTQSSKQLVDLLE